MSVPRDGITIDEDGFKSRETLRDECKGESVMDIDFIKWMCDKAEGFKFIDENTNIVKPDCQRIAWEYIQNNPYYPLLLQRAIEGVNKTKNYVIEQNEVQIVATDYSKNYPDSHYYDFEPTIDEAKELALRYIYEQEKK